MTGCYEPELLYVSVCVYIYLLFVCVCVHIIAVYTRNSYVSRAAPLACLHVQIDNGWFVCWCSASCTKGAVSVKKSIERGIFQ